MGNKNLSLGVEEHVLINFICGPDISAKMELQPASSMKEQWHQHAKFRLVRYGLETGIQERTLSHVSSWSMAVVFEAAGLQQPWLRAGFPWVRRNVMAW